MPSSAHSPAEGAFPPLVVIAGPTASGKTALSLGLAETLGDVEIISADSRQVYRGMDIGTAKVTAEERRRVPHHGLDLAAPDEAFSVADFARHAHEALAGIAARGRVALLVGGTGLYLRAVGRGLVFEHGSADTAVRAELEERLATAGLAHLVGELRARAPAIAARTDVANPRRVVRALERAVIDGDRPPPAPRGYPGRVLWLGVRVDPAVNRDRIAARARGQFATGLLDEAERLRRAYPAALRAFSALGYREAFAVVAGEIDREAAVARTAARTNAFARRQRTWFRQEPGITWIDAADAAPAQRDAMELVRAFLRR